MMKKKSVLIPFAYLLITAASVIQANENMADFDNPRQLSVSKKLSPKIKNAIARYQ